MIYKNIEIKAKHFLGSDSKLSVTILAEKPGILSHYIFYCALLIYDIQYFGKRLYLNIGLFHPLPYTYLFRRFYIV